MAKHSQEPWHVGGVGGCRPKLVYDASGRTILRSWGNGSDEENEANVELAAQAPKLREQVHALREELEKLRANVRAVGSDEMVVKRADWEARAQSADVAMVPRKHLAKWLTALRCSEPYVACGHDNAQKRLDAIESMTHALRTSAQVPAQRGEG